MKTYFKIQGADFRRSGLMFFGTPHAGGKDFLVKLGKTCARIMTAISTNPSNDIMQALQKGSLFSDILQENWRHQLNSYKIVSFYFRKVYLDCRLLHLSAWWK
jgi:hypothetical protein